MGAFQLHRGCQQDVEERNMQAQVATLHCSRCRRHSLQALQLGEYLGCGPRHLPRYLSTAQGVQVSRPAAEVRQRMHVSRMRCLVRASAASSSGKTAARVWNPVLPM